MSAPEPEQAAPAPSITPEAPAELPEPQAMQAEPSLEEQVRHPFHEPLPDASTHKNAPAMRIANLSPSACRAELARRKLAVKHAAPARGVATALRINGKIGAVRFIAHPGQSPFGVLDCRLALALEVLAETLAEHGVVSVQVDNFYRPSSKLATRKRAPSQHSHGLAMDVTRFGLADGRSLIVERDWHGGVGSVACGPEASPEAPSEETVLLRNLVCAIVRRGIFHHVLTPGYNDAHRDHLHLDIKRDGYKIGVR